MSTRRRCLDVTASSLPFQRVDLHIVLPLPAPRAAILRAVTDGWDLDVERAHVDRARSGDLRALRPILERYGPILYRSVLLPRLGNEARARDALADTYAKVVATIARYAWHPVGIYPWLRTIAFHVAIDELRARKRETPFEADDLERELDRKAESNDPDSTYFQAEDARRAQAKIEAALGDLHPRYAEAIRLRVLQELPRDDVAKRLGATPATFDVILHRAMAALRKALVARGVTSPDSSREPAKIDIIANTEPSKRAAP